MNEIAEIIQPQVPTTMKHGILSKHLLLQSEDAAEYTGLLESLRHEYIPISITEQHLVEELAGILWRKRRLTIAEAAHHRKMLRSSSTDSYSNAPHSAMIYTNTTANVGKFDIKKAVACTDADNQEELKEIAKYRKPAIKALAFLETEEANYEKALQMLADVTREWWQEEKLGQVISKNITCQPCAEHLHHFLRSEVLPYYDQQHEEVIHRPLVRQQAEGEAFMPSDRLEKFSRYEVHLDRKFERTLTVLLRLQEMRKLEKKPSQNEVA